ncbi:MAG TPA: cytochrome c oxidase assembly protein [Vicinamibacterales bacterium]
MLVACVLSPSIAIAHEAGRPAASPSGWDLAVVSLLSAGGLLYALGSWRLAQRGARVRPVERAAFWVGWAVLVLAVAPPMDRAAAWRFSSHMTQHELLMLVGAPLVVVGRPVTPWLVALPPAWRPHAAAGLQSRAMSGAWRAMTAPAVAWALHGVVIWVWHVPVLYEAAVRSEAVHAFQHATFVGTAILFWWGLVYGRYGRAAYGAAVLFVFVTALHTGILGALFTFSSAPFYPLYVARAAERGVDALTDQQLAGLVMWIPAGVILMLFGLGLLLAWLSEAERRERHRQEARRRAG